MPRSEAPRAAGRGERGFTLVEAVMVIVITGVIAAIVAQFIVRPVQGYLATVARTHLVNSADGALRRIGRDLRIALPNSVRSSSSGLAVELIPTSGSARYTTDGSGALQFGTVDTAFDTVGPALTLGAGQDLVVYNLGPNVPGADAYAANGTAAQQAASNRRSTSNAAGSATTIGLNSLAGLPVGDFAPPYRITAVNPPVTYRCDLTAGTLVRYQGYGWNATMADPPSGGSSAVLATQVTACSFSVEASAAAARAALVSLRLTLSDSTGGGSESITLQHAIFVNNLP